MGIFDGFLDSILTNNFTGWLGETYTEFELGFGKLFGHKGKMLRNIYIPKEDGTTSEIDVIYITRKGIFVIESKNYSGWIFGKAGDKEWVASLPNKQKNRFYNPIKQNQSHIKWLGNYLNDDTIPLFSIIAFSERCTLKSVPQLEDVPVVNRDNLFNAMDKIWVRKPDVVTDEKVIELFEHLKTLTKADRSVKEAHVDNINKNYKLTTDDIIVEDSAKVEKIEVVDQAAESIINPVVETSSDKEIPEAELENADDLKCPKCGADLVLRIAKKGNNAGNKFYGCSAFPKCRYIQNE